MYFNLRSNRDTFWSTTGMFPQEFVISFPSTVEIDAIKMTCSNGKELTCCCI